MFFIIILYNLKCFQEYSRLLLLYAKKSLKHYVFYNYYRSVINIVNEAGDILNEYSYDPFGRKLHQYENESSIFQYIGRYGIVRVEELEHMYSMRARLYDAEHGRFTSPDPLGELLHRMKNHITIESNLTLDGE